MTTTPADGGEDGEMWEGKLYNYNQFLGEWGGLRRRSPLDTRCVKNPFRHSLCDIENKKGALGGN